MKNRLPFMVDLAIGSVWLLFLVHLSFREWQLNLFLILFPLLRIWLSFLMHRRSQLMIAPIVMLSLMTLTTIVAGHAVTNIVFFDPWETLSKVISALLSNEMMGHTEYYEPSAALHPITLISCAWTVLLPLSIYIYHRYKKQLCPSGAGLWRSIALCVYIFTIAFTSTIISIESGKTSIALLLLGMMTMFIPIIFNRGSIKGLLTRGEISYLLTIAMIAIGYVCGLGLELKSAITVCTLPATMFALANWYLHRETTYNDILLIVAASVVFWSAQYTTHLFRIMLLLSSLILMATPVIHFAVDTKRPWTSTALYIMIALIMPIFCLGYNPYSVLNAERKWHFDKYDYSPDGLLCVGNDEHWGLRDRYGVILPLEYDRIELLTTSKPYCKVRKEGRWMIYDIERHKLVSVESFEEIVPCNKYTYRLKSDNGDKYLIMPKNYHRYDDVQPAVIACDIPANKEE